MKNPLVILMLSVAVIIAVFAIWRPSPAEKVDTPDNSQPVLTSDIESYDFGEISMAKGVVTKEFKIKNVSDQEFELKKMYTSCMCTVAWFVKGDVNKGPFGMAGHGFIPPVNETLGAGEEAVIRVIFDPAAHGPAGVGLIQRAIYLEGNGKKQLELVVSAKVIP